MGKLSKNMVDFFKIVSNDETLMRLLYYKSQNALDDPLSPSKSNLLNTNIYRSDIMPLRLKRAPKINDLLPNNTPICRLCVYMGAASKTMNHRIFKQRIVIDVFVHIDEYEVKDGRSLKIIDRLDELMLNKRITGFGDIESAAFSPIANAPDGYIGYQNVYSFGSNK